MDKTSTQFDAFLYLYNELSPEDASRFETEMLFQNALSEEVEELQKIKKALGSAKVGPSKNVLNQIKSYSAAYQAIEMPDKSHTDLLLN